MARVAAGQLEDERDTRPGSPRPSALTDDELAVLRLAAEGFTNEQIAARLSLSRETVKERLSAAIGKLGPTNRRKAINEARALGLFGRNGLGARPRGEPAAGFAHEGPGNGNRAPKPEAPLGVKDDR